MQLFVENIIYKLSLDRINSSAFLNLSRKYRTAGHLVLLQPWPAAEHLDTAFRLPQTDLPYQKKKKPIKKAQISNKQQHYT